MPEHRHGPPWMRDGGGPPWAGRPGPMFRRLFVTLAIAIAAAAMVGAVVASGFAALRGPARWLVVGVTLLFLVGFGLLATRMLGRIWSPVGSLIDATQRLGDGEGGVRITIDRPGPLAAVSAAFNRMAERLEHEEERRRRLLADLGHELRTPLSVIRGEIEAVMDGVHSPESLGDVIDEVELMERLMDDLRVLALAEAGRLQLHPERTDIGRLVADVVASFAAVCDARSIERSVTVEHAGSEIDVDPHRIHQVIANLVANAVAQMPDGGHLDVNVVHDDGTTICVADTGPGIPERDLASIFERFAKSADSTGSGLGLSIAKDLIEVHGGSISASNRPAGGAMFTIRLPPN